MTIAIPHLSFGVTEQGEPRGEITFHVHFDVCPTWLEIAARHLNDAKLRHAERVTAWQHPDQDARATALEREFESSMQAVMAAAIAIDAFYAVIRKRIAVPDSLIATWREKRTPRYSQVAEVLRLAFGLNARMQQPLRQNIREIYKLRDLAAHPSGNIEAPIFHPELAVGVEWRFVYFRYQNAKLAVQSAVQMLAELVTSAPPANPQVQQYTETVRPKLQPLYILLGGPPASTK